MYEKAVGVMRVMNVMGALSVMGPCAQWGCGCKEVVGVNGP